MIRELLKPMAELNPARLMQLARFFRTYLSQYRSQLLLAVGISLLVVAVTVLQPWPFKILFDVLLVPDSHLAAKVPFFEPVSRNINIGITVIAGLVLMLAIVRSVGEYYLNLLTTHIGQKVMVSLRRALFEHIQALSLAFHSRSRSGDLLMRLTGDVNLLRDLFVGILISAVTSVSTIVVIVGIMLALNWKLTLLAFGVMPAILLINLISGVLIRRAAHRQREKEGFISATAHEALLGIQTIQAYGQEDAAQSVFDEYTRGSFKQGMRAARIEARATQWTEITLAMGLVLVIWYGSRQVLHDPPLQTPGDLLLYYFYLRILQRPMRGGAKLMMRAGKAAASAERVMEIFSTHSEIKDSPDAINAPAFRGEIELRDVSFEYEPGRSVLKNLNLTIKAGEKIALVGVSGSGKSTICSLISRFYDPQGGEILIDGIDVRRFRIRSLRRQIGLMLQEPMLFASTIWENLAFARDNATERQIQQAARRARIHEFIKTLPKKYETEVSERGVTLSHGQKQRIALARSFLRKAPILILDEPTSNVDAESERAILKSLQKLIDGVTCILITHNLRLVRDIDRIIFLSEGKIVEEGTHDELIKLNGYYARLAGSSVETSAGSN